MRIPVLAALALLASWILNTPAHSAAPKSDRADRVLKVEGGKIEGAVSGGVLSFKGVPYAAPPVGPLRWRAPQPAEVWTGVKAAKAFGHDCMQVPEPGDVAPIRTKPSEDCLVLNIWRPAKANKEAEKLPVMIWIHGGAFVNGGTSAPVYDGSAFAKQGILFASFNYRLGRFGFFAHPALTGAQEGALGNYGYLDQVAALNWLHRNIEAFGGDPDRVTLVGESAGGIAILDLIASRAVAGLFQQAVVMSGGGRMPVVGGRPLLGTASLQPSAEEIGLAFAHSVGVEGDGAEALKALRALPPEKVRGNLNMSTLLDSGDSLTFARGPMVDGITYIGPPGEMLGRSGAADVPLLIGTTSQDLALPATLPSKDEIFALFGSDADSARAVYDPDGRRPLSEVSVAVSADQGMTEPARYVARRFEAAGHPVWLYRFAYVADSMRPKWSGARHASEVPYFFGTIAARYGEKATADDLATQKSAHAYLSNYVKQSDPNGKNLTEWPEFGSDRSDLMIFTDLGPAVMPDPWQERLDLLERAAKVQAEKTAQEAGKSAQERAPRGG